MEGRGWRGRERLKSDGVWLRRASVQAGAVQRQDRGGTAGERWEMRARASCELTQGGFDWHTRASPDRPRESGPVRNQDLSAGDKG